MNRLAQHVRPPRIGLRFDQLGPRIRQPHAIVIGSGFGGLAAAVRLGARGYRVSVFERLDAPGGRAYVYYQDGFTFDAGPTIITAPFLLEELWRLCGRTLSDDVDLRPISPFYRIRFDDGETFEYSGDANAMRAEVARFAPSDVAGYDRLMRISESIFRVGFEQLGHLPFNSWRDMLRIVPQMLRLGSHRSVYDLVAREIKDPRLRVVFSFHPLLIGGNPFTTTSIYALITFLERRWGVHFAMGGTGKLIEGLVSLVTGQGGAVHLNSHVDSILVRNDKVAGIRLANGAQVDADIVVSNADPAWTYAHLHPAGSRSVGSHAEGSHVTGSHARESHAEWSHADGGRHATGTHAEETHAEWNPGDGSHPVGSHTAESPADVRHSTGPHRRRPGRHLAGATYSMSLFVWYFGTRRRYDDVGHHTILLGPRYRELLADIFQRKILAKDFSLYLHRPTATDNSLAPPGCDAFYVLSPVPHLQSGVDWTVAAEPYRQAIAARLEQTLLPGLQTQIATSRVLTPLDFQDRLLSFQGAAFGMEPVLSQSAWFRPHNRSEDIEGLYLVGAGTHPGAGVPGVLSSARVLDRVVPDASVFA